MQYAPSATDRPNSKSDFMSRKFPAHYAAIVLPLVLSLLMTFVISGVSTLMSLGPTRAFVTTWPAAWALSWIVAFPSLVVLLPLVRRLVALVVEAPPQK
jgi:hypothetical protein